jgi:hypothetical protein
LTKNDHLIPPIIIDIVIQLDNLQIAENERMALIQRLETVRDFCIKNLNRLERKIQDENKKQALKTKVRYKK